MSRMPTIRPIWIVLVIVVALAAWLASGMVGGDEPAGEAAPKADQAQPVSVAVRTSTAEQVWREVELNGRTAPDRAVTLRAQTAGRIDSVNARRGARVEAGEVLARIALDDRGASRNEARAVVKQRRLQYEAVRKMSEKGYQTRTDLAQAKSDLEAAQAQLANIQQDIDNTVVRAPFAGVLETRPVEVGDYVAVGDEIARVIQQNPFVVRGDLAEKDVAFVEPGQPGRARLIDGSTVEGRVRYVATEADEATRTYPVELEVDNPGGRLVSGASAKLILPLEQVEAHEVAADLLTLDEAGEMGIKTIGEDGRVAFHGADIVKSSDQRLWLGGLPESVRLITSGQGFVRAGDAVQIVDDADAAAGAAGAAAPGEKAQPAANDADTRS
ncbi:efflux RND transporter periplasmic adaptor subunit [Salinisphaera sp.]|uniref:efflux RND transporter periplasmic adaptor subunit n=1 Tax=Salinisphaera sp. TaxID=1914330 RepID=UPI000C3CB6B9|nr:efflux RND transporter periplasmic adaptor subunit [Salinisphaera sp.]MBS64230.1 efflux transporter periplasmic adaptor subunit [Salinisphaera sp.]